MKPKKEDFEEVFDRSVEIRNKIIFEQSLRPKHLESGDLFYLNMPLPFPVTWCAVFTHSDDPCLWYCVPGDSFSCIASTDVKSQESAVRVQLNFRCHCGLWVHTDDIDLANRIDQLKKSDVQSIQDTLARIANDPLSVFAADDISEDPDYVEWIEDLRISVAALAHLLHDEPDSNEGIRLRDWNEQQNARRHEIEAQFLATQAAFASGTPGIDLVDWTNKQLGVLDDPFVKIEIGQKRLNNGQWELSVSLIGPPAEKAKYRSIEVKLSESSKQKCDIELDYSVIQFQSSQSLESLVLVDSNGVRRLVSFKGNNVA